MCLTIQVLNHIRYRIVEERYAMQILRNIFTSESAYEGQENIYTYHFP